MLRYNDKHKSSGVKAFTLIELLVVISIISMLMSITLPSLSRAREAGNRVHCASNLKSLTTAWLMYALENDDRLCSPGTGWNFDNGCYWVADGLVSPCNATGGTESAIKEGVLWPYLQNTEAYKCKTDSTKLLRSYSLSRAMAGSCKDGNIKPFTSWPTIKNSSQKMVFVDAESKTRWIAGSFCAVVDIDAAEPKWFRRNSRNISARHSDGCNIAFADSHCKYWKYGDPRTTKFANWQISSEDASSDNVDLERMVELLKGR